MAEINHFHTLCPAAQDRPKPVGLPADRPDKGGSMGIAQNARARLMGRGRGHRRGINRQNRSGGVLGAAAAPALLFCLEPVHGAGSDDQHPVLRAFEAWDQRRVEAEGVGTQAARDTAVGDDDAIARDRLCPPRYACKEIGIAFAAFRAPASAELRT